MTEAEAINIVQRLPLTVDDFLLLDESGAFERYGKTELIEGEIFYMNAQHSRHGRTKTTLAFALNEALKNLSSNFDVIVEVSVRIAPASAPIPDIIITSHKGDGLVPAETVSLVVEIADTTQKSDLGAKATLYAKAEIKEYWVLDLKKGILHQFWLPKVAAYTQSKQIPLGEMICAKAIDGLTIRLPA